MRLLFATALVASLLAGTAVHACGGGFDPLGRWSLDQREYNGGSALPFLNPGNDNRLNLQMLMFGADPHKGQDGASAGSGASANTLDASIIFRQFNYALAVGGSGLDYSSLLDNQSGVTTAFGTDEGSRCFSSQNGKKAFTDAVQAEARLSAGEKTLLTDARAKMTSACEQGNAPIPWQDPFAGAPQPSVVAQNFAEYLAGAQAFYDGDFDTASSHFNTLAKADNPWLRESASYMSARTLLNKAQIGAFAELDGAPEPKVTDQASVSAAETQFNAYLSAYPSGRYAASARGLLRRLYWLAGDHAHLATEYGWQVTHIGDAQANLNASDLAQEIDSKYLGAADGENHDPNLLAIADLMKFRTRGTTKPDFPVAQLDAQAPDFAGHEALFAFLKAARAYYVDGDAAQTLQLLGAPSSDLSPPYLAFSREVLRGQALMASGQFPQAADHWQKLLPLAAQPGQKETVELGLAMSWEQGGTLNKAFLAGTPIDAPSIRAILLRYSAGPILLRMAMADTNAAPPERALARFALLFKEATRGHYAGFLQDSASPAMAIDETQVPAGLKADVFAWAGTNESYPCPDLKSVVGELAKDARSPHGLLCLAEFVRTAYFDDVEKFKPAADELGGKPIFPGEVFSRGEIYKRLIADPATPDKERAYALYRAVYCYARTGHNNCGGQDVDKAQRKAWFTMLKKKYGSTSWAQDLTYYW